MGFFLENSLAAISDEEFIADESYIGELGAARIMIEAAENDDKIFNACISNDFKEVFLARKVAKLQESVVSLEEGSIELEEANSKLEEANTELETFEEASVGGFVNTVIEYIKSAAAKVKGLIMSFVLKVGAAITRSNKELVKKYKGKINDSTDYSKMKYKWNDTKDAFGDGVSKATVSAASYNISNIIKNEFEGHSSDGDKSDKLDDLCSNFISGSSYSSYKKDSFNAHFESVETREGPTKDFLNKITNILEHSDKKLKAIKDSVPKVDKVFNDLIREAKEASKKINKNSGKAGETSYKLDGSDRTVRNDGETVISNQKPENATKRLTAIKKAAELSQKVYSLVLATDIKEYKFHIRQCRRVFVQAATYSVRKQASSTKAKQKPTKKSVEETDILLDAIGEAADYEFESEIEEVEYSF